MKRNRLIAALALFALAAVSGAWAQTKGNLEIEHSWARATPPGASVGGGFATVRNAGAEADKLIGASSPEADRVELYARLRAMEGVRVYESAANFVLARFPQEIVKSLDAELRRRGFIVKFFKEPGFLDCARITLGTREENAGLLDAMTSVLPSLLTAKV